MSKGAGHTGGATRSYVHVCRKAWVTTDHWPAPKRYIRHTSKPTRHEYAQAQCVLAC